MQNDAFVQPLHQLADFETIKKQIQKTACYAKVCLI